MSKTPFDSEEYKQQQAWLGKTASGGLSAVPVLCAWQDICGFGSRLAEAGWDLRSDRVGELMSTLSNVYQLVHSPRVASLGGISEHIIVLNDGIARSVDAIDGTHFPVISFAFYVRDLILSHLAALEVLVNAGLSIRTILAGGARMQYAHDVVTGHSLLSYGDPPSPASAEFLAKVFLYHPAEFQMNLGFSRAYLIDALGTKGGIEIDRMYLETAWIDVAKSMLPNNVVHERHGDVGSVRIQVDGNDYVTVEHDLVFERDVRGMPCSICRIARLVVHPALEGEVTTFDVHRGWTLRNTAINSSGAPGEPGAAERQIR